MLNRVELARISTVEPLRLAGKVGKSWSVDNPGRAGVSLKMDYVPELRAVVLVYGDLPAIMVPLDNVEFAMMSAKAWSKLKVDWVKDPEPPPAPPKVATPATPPVEVVPVVTTPKAKLFGKTTKKTSKKVGK